MRDLCTSSSYKWSSKAAIKRAGGRLPAICKVLEMVSQHGIDHRWIVTQQPYWVENVGPFICCETIVKSTFMTLYMCQVVAFSFRTWSLFRVDTSTSCDEGGIGFKLVCLYIYNSYIQSMGIYNGPNTYDISKDTILDNPRIDDWGFVSRQYYNVSHVAIAFLLSPTLRKFPYWKESPTPLRFFTSPSSSGSEWSEMVTEWVTMTGSLCANHGVRR